VSAIRSWRDYSLTICRAGGMVEYVASLNKSNENGYQGWVIEKEKGRE
jgi:hypothetical protein